MVADLPDTIMIAKKNIPGYFRIKPKFHIMALSAKPRFYIG